MKRRSIFRAVLLASPASPTFAEPDNPDKCINAVRQLADSMLKYGRDAHALPHYSLQGI